MNVSVWNILDLNEAYGERGVEALTTDFTTARNALDAERQPLNASVDMFLKKNALQFAKERKSITYLVFDGEDSSLVGYFTIAHKPIEIFADGLSNTSIRKLDRHARYHEKLGSYLLSGFLIAQFSKNYGVDSGTRITGDELMALCERELVDLQRRVGGGIQYLDCEANAKLISFYENLGFRLFGERFSEQDGKRYLQYMRFF